MSAQLGLQLGTPAQHDSDQLEVHTHSYVTGPNARTGRKVEHSHSGGSEPHRHPDMGPASYVIDSDEWYAATGTNGGGRKQFTSEPSGPQLETVQLAEHERTFEIIYTESAKPADGNTGGGHLAAERVMQQLRLRPQLRVLP